MTISRIVILSMFLSCFLSCAKSVEPLVEPSSVKTETETVKQVKQEFEDVVLADRTFAEKVGAIQRLLGSQLQFDSLVKRIGTPGSVYSSLTSMSVTYFEGKMQLLVHADDNEIYSISIDHDGSHIVIFYCNTWYESPAGFEESVRLEKQKDERKRGLGKGQGNRI